jgi:hypothetical protein
VGGIRLGKRKKIAVAVGGLFLMKSLAGKRAA